MYLMHVLDPENTEPCRIPNEFSVKTALAHADRFDILSTDANGNLLIKGNFNVMGLTNASVRYNNDGTWSTTTDNDAITALNNVGIDTGIDTGQGKHRLVAYKIKLRYIGAELNRSGIFFASVCTETDANPSALWAISLN